MSKKMIITGAIVVAAAVAILPLVGNKSIEKVTQERISMLEKNGIEVVRSDSGSGYMTTKSHYVFTLKDEVAFEKYLATLSEAQTPAYLNTMLNDVVMAADVEYSNILVSSDVSLDLYPVAFSEAAGRRMKEEDAGLYKQMMAMLDNKTFMYHMNYDVAGSKFDGYIKDINQKITFKDTKTANIVFEGATFVGDGTLVEPKSVDLNVKHADVNLLLPDASSMELSMNNLESKNSFKSKNSFDLNYKAKKLHLFYKDQEGELDLSVAEMSTLSDSNVVKGKLSTQLNTSMKNFEMKDANGSLKFVNFNFVLDAENIDESAYEAFQKATEQAGPSSQYTMLAGIGVLSKGFSLHVKELSVEKLSINNAKMMNGFNHKIDIVLKEDDALVQKIQMAPMALVQNITIDAALDFSNDFYNYAKMQNPNLLMADNYAKKENNHVLFDLTFKEGKVSVNGQSL